MHRFLWYFSIFIGVFGLLGPALAQPSERLDALGALTSPQPERRAQAVIVLGNEGRMADVPALLERLRDEEPAVRALAEQAIWAVWSRSGDPEVDALFAQGVAEMQSGESSAAIATFTRVIELKPDFAEGWNKRATVYFLVGDYQHSLADCAEVVRRNPNHFGVLAGYGQIYLHLEEFDKALEYFRRALAVNPNLDGVRTIIEALEARARGKRQII
ncbi:MAG: tetratricopeptide repeat protein [Burkholderiales bacterium]